MRQNAVLLAISAALVALAVAWLLRGPIVARSASVLVPDAAQLGAQRIGAGAPIDAPADPAPRRSAEAVAAADPVRSAPLDEGPREPAGQPPGERPTERAGTLEVLVLEDDRPRMGSEVRLYRGGIVTAGWETVSTELEHPVEIEATASARTDGLGSARFDGLAQDRYDIAIEPDGHPAGLTQVRLRPGATRLVVPLGTAGLQGTVYGADGTPQGNVEVTVFQAGRAGESTVRFSARSGAFGAYRMPGLAGGNGRSLTAALLDRSPTIVAGIELAPGAWRELDFGSPCGTVAWSGHVRLRTGAVLEGPERLWFGGGDGTALEGRFAEDGRFDVRLPCGSYTARLGKHTGPVLGELELVADTAQDLVVPGIVLSGTIAYVGAKHPRADGPVREVVLALQRADGGPSPVVLVRGDARYAFCGLEPGRHILTTRPWVPVGAADGRVLLDIGPTASEVVHDLAITDP